MRGVFVKRFQQLNSLRYCNCSNKNYTRWSDLTVQMDGRTINKGTVDSTTCGLDTYSSHHTVLYSILSTTWDRSKSS